MSEQRTPEWFAARCGRATASRMADIVATTKTGWGASRANYAAQLVAERLTGTPAVGYESAEMRWGTETEPHARAAYEFYTDTEVVEVGFIEHPMIAMSGASPDGLVGEDGLLEIKCPLTATHIDTLLGASIPKKYRLQALWQLVCTQRKWCDVVSFDPRMPEEMKFWVQRVAFESDEIAMLEADVSKFLAEVATTVASLRAKFKMAEAA